MPTAGGYLPCIRELGFSLSVGTEYGLKPVSEIILSPASSPTSEVPHVLFLSGAQASSPSENCTRIRKLGYIVGKHMNLYGQHMALVSDPFVEGDCVAVHAISSSNPTVRRIKLPVSILAGWEDLFQELANPTASELTATTRLPGPVEAQ